MSVLALLAQLLVVSPAGPYTAIAAAVAAAPDGATITVRAGRYREPAIVLPRRVTLQGEPGAVLDGEGTHEIVRVRGPGITVRGLTFTNTGISFREDRAALRVDEATDCAVEDNRFDGTFFAIYLSAAHRCRVTGNVVTGRSGGDESGTGNGVHSWGSRQIEVARNTISGHRDGIYLEFTKQADVHDNTSSRNIRYGIHFMYSDSSAYRRNRFLANGSGVAVMYTTAVTMEGNTFADNRGTAAYGLLLKEIQDAHLTGNLFLRNKVGLMCDGADRLIATGNTFDDNGYALRLLGSTVSGTLAGNAFHRNGFDVAVNGSGGGARFDGNYWDDYRGWDLDRDGRGDIPAHPVRLFAVIVERTDAALLLQHSLFVRLLDLAERVLPVLTPREVADAHPLMRDPSGSAR